MVCRKELGNNAWHAYRFYDDQYMYNYNCNHISVSNRSKLNFHVNSVAFARHVVQQLCHERVFLYI